MSVKLFEFIREQYRTNNFIPLHEPFFKGEERKYVIETIESSFVSSIGKFVSSFENEIAKYTNSPYAVATVNGTSALHVALQVAGVQHGDLVLTQAASFVATSNAISYLGGEPVFVDIDKSTLGFSAAAAENWLLEHAFIDDEGTCRTKSNRKVIRACVPMHTFGHPVKLDALIKLCSSWQIPIVEDAAEALGSFFHERHAGTFGLLGALSFNGNKIITTGGGGMILTNPNLGEVALHLSTTAKLEHPYNYVHDAIAYNYRMPNINAALGCAQLENLEKFISAKRSLASRYASFLKNSHYQFFTEPENCRSNYWLNTLVCEDKKHRDNLLNSSREAGIMTRPLWTLLNNLPMYQHCLKGDLTNSEWLSDRLVNIPSSVMQECFDEA